MADIVTRLVYKPSTTFTKHCENFRFNSADRDIRCKELEVDSSHAKQTAARVAHIQ